MNNRSWFLIWMSLLGLTAFGIVGFVNPYLQVVTDSMLIVYAGIATLVWSVLGIPAVMILMGRTSRPIPEDTNPYASVSAILTTLRQNFLSLMIVSLLVMIVALVSVMISASYPITVYVPLAVILLLALKA